MIYGASNFLNFILGEVFLFVLGIFDRIYLDGILEGIWHILVFIYDRVIDFIIARTPKYLKAAASEFFRPGEGEEERRKAKREVSGVDLVGDTSESVEPILDAFG